MHLAAGCSLAETAARARTAGLAQLSAVALFKRLQASEEWLRWLAAEQRKLLAAPLPESVRRLRAVDATAVSEPGSTGTNWRVHYSINLRTLQCDFFEITDFRAYSNAAGIAHVGGLAVTSCFGSIGKRCLCFTKTVAG
jgi:hypothetical protein